MNKKLFAIAGLPRSGSTLLMSILNQNPEITVGPDSELSKILEHNRIFLRGAVVTAQLPHKQFEELGIQFCRSGSEAWINQVCPTSFFVDKNREWFYQYDFKFRVFPELKIIVCLRDLRFVIESFLKRADVSLAGDLRSTWYANLQTNFMHSSIDWVFKQHFMREPLTSLKELEQVKTKFKPQVYFLKYENLVQNKQLELDKIYKFLEMDRFEHNLTNIAQFEPHFDNVYQPFGDHTIQNSIPDEFNPEFEYLTRWGQEYILQDSRWFFEMFYPEVLAA